MLGQRSCPVTVAMAEGKDAIVIKKALTPGKLCTIRYIRNRNETNRSALLAQNTPEDSGIEGERSGLALYKLQI